MSHFLEWETNPQPVTFTVMRQYPCAMTTNNIIEINNITQTKLITIPSKILFNFIQLMIQTKVVKQKNTLRLLHLVGTSK